MLNLQKKSFNLVLSEFSQFINFLYFMKIFNPLVKMSKLISNKKNFFKGSNPKNKL